MKRFLFAPLATAILLLSTLAATAAPLQAGPHHPAPRERARYEARHRHHVRPALRRPLPPHQRPMPPYHR